jgi:hypothetical protein
VRIPCLPGLFQTQRGHDHLGDSPDSSSRGPKIFAALDMHIANVSTELCELSQQQKNACSAIAENSEFFGKLVSSAWYGDHRDGKHLQPAEKFAQLKNVISDKQFQILGITVQRKLCSDMSTHGMSKALLLSAHFLVTEPSARRFAEQATQTSPALDDREITNKAAIDQSDSNMSWPTGWGYLTPEKLRALSLQKEALKLLDDAIATGGRAPVVHGETI